MNTVGNGVRPFSRLVPSKQPGDQLEPYPYQEEVWQELNTRLAQAQSDSKGAFAGLLVMPTGSGKTFTTVRWLTKNHINSGGRVLWIAHRHDLLEQAAQAFRQAAFLARDQKKLWIRIVSGQHDSPTKVSPKDDNIVLWSIQSLGKRMDIAKAFLKRHDVFVVVDEAHHAAAKGYRRVLSLSPSRKRFFFLGSPKHRYVLGLTATPTRTIEDERPILRHLFPDGKLCEVKMRKLIEQGYLARPYPEVVKTGVEAEKDVTPEDKSHLARFNELSKAWNARLARVVPRNELITRRYLDNRDRYAKTLVFAIDVAHAQLLRDRFREAGVRAEYVASYRLDKASLTNQEVINRFRDSNGDLDVLINVEILTEGSDIPSIKTVFLTRPTHSEIRFRQMVGRAMRGPKIPGGTERAYLVSFQDHWSEFTDWESPFDLVLDIVEEAGEPGETEEAEPPRLPKPLVENVPWDLIKSTADEIRRRGYGRPGVAVNAFEAIPHGWYVLEREDEQEGGRQIIPVYEHQRSCWQALIRRLWPDATTTGGDETEPTDRATKPVRRELSQSAEEIYDDFFHDCDVPKPGHRDIRKLTEYFLAGGDAPEYTDLPARLQVDPAQIAQEIFDGDMSESARDRLVTKRYELPLAKAIYPRHCDFDEAVNHELFKRRHPDQATGVPKVEVVFEPLPDRPLRPGPAHELKLYMKDVRVRGAKLLDCDPLPFNGECAWTRRRLRNHLGRANWKPDAPRATGIIQINCLLNSPDVSKGTLCFLLWHEFLHLYLQEGHTPKFRELERKWPGYMDADRELDMLEERFELRYR